RAQISRLIPPSVVEQVVKGELTIEKGGRLTECTMLFSDIRGFTTMSDGRPAQEIVNTLNEYFEVMVDILFKYSGTLDKFVGDEIIGLFGAPIALDDAPFKAVACGLAMLQALEEFNRRRAAENPYRHVAGRIEATQLPPVKVKGKAEELKVYRVTGMRSIVTPLPGDWSG